jgi:threonylcarbamoyladenosine tRNA methylthiotransferase MtaB
MSNLPTVAFHTLGCKLNFAETSTISRQFKERGFRKVDFDSTPDVYVINTCSVTENADKECRQLVRKALSINPDAFIAVVGCYAQLQPDQIAGIEGVDVVLGANEKFNLLSFLGDLSKKESASVHSCEIAAVTDYRSSYSLGDRTRAFLKVQDGCDYTCSYCTIPGARGASRSDTVEGVVKQAEEIASRGVREIVLTGVNIGDFGLHPGASSSGKRKESFTDLVKALDHVEGIDRFRISSIEPNLLSDEIIDFVASSNRFVPHFHIPLQSGSDRILRLMRRRYPRSLYTERVTRIKSVLPHACIGADVITGFPSETEEDFLETYRFLQEIDVSYLHVFTYSERAGTDAPGMAGAVPMQVRKQRNKRLRILSAKKQRAFYEAHSGDYRTVLVESVTENGAVSGHTDNYLRVVLPGDASMVNRLVEVRLGEISEDGIFIGEPVELTVNERND